MTGSKANESWRCPAVVTREIGRHLARPLRETGATVTITIEELSVMDPDAAAALYRVARETLTNIAKHAHASTITIDLGPMPGPAATAVRLRVSDDGVGLASGALDRRSEGHFGLHMLNDRITDLGGQFTINAAPAGGTIAEAIVPTHPDT